MPPLTSISAKSNTKTDSSRAPSGLIQQGVNSLQALLFDRKWYWPFVFLLLIGEALLGVLIIWKIPYTKIDWPAYMQQVEMFLDGERDYSKIEGETGPLVYPALHLYIYTLFYKFLPSIESIRPAQYMFLGFYLITLLLVSTVYYLSGSNNGNTRNKHYPQILLIPLCLSKRLHSIFLLRLFNDPIAMMIFYGSVVAMMKGGKTGWRIGSTLYSLALGVKMNILLFLPGLLVVLFQYRGIYGTIESILAITIIQLLLPAPYFLSSTYLSKAYFTSAFDFSRQFLYEWTVNWRFIDEKMFLSRERATLLLAGHLGVVILFASFKWSPIPGGTLTVLKNGLDQWSRPAIGTGQLPSYHIPLTLFISNLIGILFARSLHYQFQSWYFHQLPFLLYSGGAWNSLPLGITIWLMIEYAWEITPATPLSSGLLVLGHVLILGGLFYRRSGVSNQGKAEKKSQ
ncbi:dolichyl-P-Man:Man(5)GlcNAc(2)-PP-dolichyl mannosyltransferase [Kwoniella mangroviensis CBS 10435]|uniref:Dol-P-Man:Man(5)GlcNAc(2)-PP-Dol alpha-1,3-mannosyltransferase n=1 Tax=Kwoniella mangroviensis CBS 10435 TaxID=1331196 RepID=A0A1B9IZP8_9TREE|nr:dolichyl-P-Man:Man(5)GlcNAc(2)-PP-dolichyl mannosyltransferase [Kwoniella mangroviensis CBS 10435]